MRDPTLIPDAHTYGLAVLVMGSLGCLPIAAHVRAWLGGQRRVSLAALYIAVMAAMVVWSCLVLDPRRMLGFAPAVWAAAIVAGVAAGALVVRADRAIVRWFAWRRPRPSVRPMARARPTYAAAWQADLGTGPGYRGLAAIVLVALLEELIFRGILVQLSLTLLAAGAIVGSLAMFSLLHLAFGWANVTSKTVLGGACLAASLLFGSVDGAVALHVTFNAATWAQARPASAGGR